VKDEYYKTGQTDSLIAEYVFSQKFNKVYPDPEAPSAIKELTTRGVNVRTVTKNKDSIPNGINKIKELLKAGKLKVHKRCIRQEIMEAFIARLTRNTYLVFTDYIPILQDKKLKSPTFVEIYFRYAVPHSCFQGK
jgi:hypothetical protein